MPKKRKQTIATNVMLDPQSVEYIETFAKKNHLRYSAALEKITQEYIDMKSESLLDEVIKLVQEEKGNEL